MNDKSNTETARIRELNDALRVQGVGGRVMLTVGIQALGQEKIKQIMDAIRSFNEFCDDNDPYVEHDFAKVVVDGIKVFYKIDYYDTKLEYASSNPADSTLTCRVMTIMLASEY